MPGPIAMLADAIDPSSGEYLSIERGTDPIDAAVLVALRTVRASGSAVGDVGQRFADQQLVDPQMVSFFQQEAKFALQHLVDAKQISIQSIDVVPGDDWGEVQVKYFNEVRRAEGKAVVRINGLLGKAAA